jgi:hypothetical protein
MAIGTLELKEKKWRISPGWKPEREIHLDKVRGLHFP